MMGLITSTASLASATSVVSDQSAHSGSSVMRSRMMLLSIRTAAMPTLLVFAPAPSQGHDLVSRHAAVPPTAPQPANEPLATALSPVGLRLDDLHHPVHINHIDFGLRQQPRQLPNFHRNSHLPLRSNPHPSQPPSLGRVSKVGRVIESDRRGPRVVGL